MTEILHVSDDSFETEVLNSDNPVLVDYWAEWCGPCKMISPILDELAEENAGKLKVGKVDVDNNQELATQFSIRAIPTLLLFKDGQIKETMVGAVGKKDLEKKLADHIG